MVEVIETNIFVDNDNRIYDHQSRIIEVEDWDTYCNAFELYDGRAIYFKSKQMPGNSIQANRKIKELLYDDYLVLFMMTFVMFMQDILLIK